MRKFFTKKVLASVTVASLVLSVGSISYAASTLKKITAYQDSATKIEVGGALVDLTVNGNRLDPITYEGRTYVPALPVAEALGASVLWDSARKTVVITPASETPPVITPPSAGSGTANNSGSTASSSNKGTLADPVQFGSSFTYTDYVNYEPGIENNTTAQYTVTVKKVASLSLDQLVALGYERPTNTGMNFLMLDVNLKTKKATFKKGSNSLSDYYYLSQYKPSIWGSKTAEGDGVIGGRDFGFEGSLSKNIDAVLKDFPTVKAGDSKSFEANGKILLPVVKTGESYLVLRRNDSTLEYDDTFIYFKLR
jgi:hypothetical protein